MTMQNALTVPDLVDQAAQAWRDSLALRVEAFELAQTTERAYYAGASKFLTWCKAQGVDLVTGESVLRWQADLFTRGIGHNTVSVWLAGVRSFFGWAVGNRLVTVDPTTGVKGPKRKGTSKRHLRDPLTDSEVLRVLGKPDPTTAQGARDGAILALLAYCALRSVEIHRADLGDLQTQGGRLVLLLQGKGRREKDEIAVIPAPAEEALHDWLSARGQKSGSLFYSLSPRSWGERLSLRAIRGLVKGYYQAAGVAGERKTTHSLRHSAITKAAQVLPLQKVQGMARHASPETTAIYYHEIDRLTNPAEDVISYGGKVM